MPANLFKLFCTTILLLAFATPGFCQSPPPQTLPIPKPSTALSELSDSIEELATAASPAVVRISVHVRAPLDKDSTDKTGFVTNEEVTGSGVIVDSDGYIITNSHVVNGAHRIDISVMIRNAADHYEDHAHYEAKILGVDRETDLALLKVDAKGLPTLAFFDSDKLKQGQVVVALGSPLGLENSLTVGYVSAPMRHLGSNKPMFYVQTDAAINPGNSGGPLLDITGHIVGINTLILTQSGGSEGIGFAIPSNVVAKVYQQLRTDGRVRRGVIGVVPEDITPVLASALGVTHHSGVILSDVTPGSSAAASDLRQGDVIRAADGKPVRDAMQLSAAIFRHSIGDQITLDIERNKEPMQIKVPIMEAPRTPASLTEIANGDDNLVRQLGILALTLDEKVTGILPGLRRLSGVVVAAIPAEFAGANPGLLTGDVIYELNGIHLTTLEDLQKALATKKTHDPIALLVERQGQLIYVTVELE
jgi:serine protease Do